MKILVISNGYGEDVIGRNLVQAFRQQHPGALITAFPLVGDGHYYKTVNVTPALHNPVFPSGGFLRSVFDIIKDIKAGLVKHIFKQRNAIKNCFLDADIILCVGDVFCLIMGGFQSPKPVFFLPTAKSDTFMPHSWLEYLIIKKLAKKIYPRDGMTTRSFQKRGLQAAFFGNPMMDQLHATQHPISSKKEDPFLALLPGSREEAYQNLGHSLKVLEQLATIIDIPLQYVIAKAPSLDWGKLAAFPKWTLDVSKRCLVHRHPTIYVHISDDFESVISYASLVLGLAGTANEQAIHVGKTVLCFEGFGPQSTQQRFKEQQRLVGDRLVVLEGRQPSYVAQYIRRYYKKKTDTVTHSEQHASKTIILDILEIIENSSKVIN